MNTAKVQALHSPAYESVRTFFSNREPPFTITDIREFNAIYRRAYPDLAPVERQHSEVWVDYLIAHVKDRSDARRVYGVV